MTRDCSTGTARFLVRITVHVERANLVPDWNERAARERHLSLQLADEGRIEHIWRVTGELGSVSVWAVRDLAELDALLAALPLRDWMSIETTAIEDHPITELIRVGGAMGEHP